MKLAWRMCKQKREEKNFTAKNAKRPSRNQKIERSPSYISPSRGREERGLSASGIGFLVSDFDFWFSDLIVSFVWNSSFGFWILVR